MQDQLSYIVVRDLTVGLADLSLESRFNPEPDRYRQFKQILAAEAPDRSSGEGPSTRDSWRVSAALGGPRRPDSPNASDDGCNHQLAQ